MSTIDVFMKQFPTKPEVRQTTRKEARDLVDASSLPYSSKLVMKNAIGGTFRRDTDNTETTVKMTMDRMFKGVNVKERRKIAILAELRESNLITFERYAGKITYSLNFNPLREPKFNLHTRPLTALELGFAVRKPVTLEHVRSWAATA